MDELLAIIEVDRHKRVRCCAPNCGRSIYKKVHVVRVQEKIQVIGETCFAHLFGSIINGSPKYTGSNGRKLTDDERLLLVENTELLIRALEREYTRADEISAITSSPEIVRAKPQNQASAGQSDSLASTANSERTVRCNYCGSRMTTRYQFIPAAGFKCEQCRAANSTLPVNPRYLK